VKSTSPAKPISFERTLKLLLSSKQTSTRRAWSDRFVKQYIKCYKANLAIEAFDKDKRRGGVQIGWLKLTEIPYTELLIDMPPSDLGAEGFPKYSVEQYINRFFDGDSLQQVWVFKFEFEPLQNRIEEKPISDKADTNTARAVVAEVVLENDPLNSEWLKPLSTGEKKLRDRLEEEVNCAFVAAGGALKQLLEKRLYRDTHLSFESYCKDKFNFSRDYAYLKIGASQVYKNIADNLSADSLLPSNENQLRFLVKADLEPEVQVELWMNAVNKHPVKPPSGRVVKETIAEYLAKKNKIPNPFRLDEVCTIVAKDNPELRGKSGCWCIVSGVHEFSCTVDTWETQYVLRLEHLNSSEYTESECQQMRELGWRMSRLASLGNLDDAALWILNGLARMQKAYLTDIEEELLSFLENKYLPEEHQ
jgi:hypothetical protein